MLFDCVLLINGLPNQSIKCKLPSPESSVARQIAIIWIAALLPVGLTEVLNPKS